MNTQLENKAMEAKQASVKINKLSKEDRNNALNNVIEALDKNRDRIIKENEIDLTLAEQENIAEPLIQRLHFDNSKIDSVISGIKDLIEIDDILDNVELKRELAPGLILEKKTVPIGVLGIIFESRPDAFVQIASLAIKSGNSVLLKGGRESMNTNKILDDLISDATKEAGLPEGWIQNLTTRGEVNDMLALDDYIDLVIPRGSNEFVSYIMENTKIPVLGHADGICHTYVDKDADLSKALEICDDGKRQYVSVCNATETILVHEDVAEEFLPKLYERFNKEPKVKILGDERVCEIIPVDKATDDDWTTEYLDYIVSVKVVPSLEEAIDHINTNGSHHTDSIVSENEEAIDTFSTLVDSACVFNNCSTRFSDGLRFGFGAEVGISTSKIHARGPVGIDGLTTYKYVLNGDGDIVADFSNGKREFTHQDI